MSNRLLVATRKGLFTLDRDGSNSWSIASTDFAGDNVSMVLADARDGRTYAALDHGHFGVKLHRRSGTATWEECAAPAYPPQPEGQTDTDPMGRTIPWTTVKLWALEPGGADQPGLLWCGTLPGGLFRSTDSGTSWELIRAVVGHIPSARNGWVAATTCRASIPSAWTRATRAWCAPRVSVGGIWTTRDGGETWSCDYEGMRAAYMPPEKMYDPNSQDAHRLVQCAGAPDALWVQHHNGIFHSTDGGVALARVSRT